MQVGWNFIIYKGQNVWGVNERIDSLSEAMEDQSVLMKLKRGRVVIPFLMVFILLGSGWWYLGYKARVEAREYLAGRGYNLEVVTEKWDLPPDIEDIWPFPKSVRVKRIDNLYFATDAAGKDIVKIVEPRPGDFEALSKLRYLETCTLHDAGIGDEDLAHFGSLRKLAKLDLVGNPITGGGLIHLASLAELRELDLSGTDITDEGLENIKHLPKLTKLDLGGTRITDDGLVHLASLTELGDLNLAGTDVTLEGLAHLKPLIYLKELGLWDTVVDWRKVREVLPGISSVYGRSVMFDSDEKGDGSR